MATNERKDRPREAERAGEKGTREAGTREAGATGAASRVVPQPDAEEAPELLGERSDYPATFGDEGEKER